PTTLPTLDELINRAGITVENVAQHLLRLTEHPASTGHVYTLHAELEGGKWKPVFEQLLSGWKKQGYELVAMQQYRKNLAQDLPRHEVVMGAIEGRSGILAMQGSHSGN
ncbi:MAG: 4-deoxy-4-formamido-L-arabinose-phosphoundecaprenol deformylase, partial [Gallionellaceae bacterium]|nr:4-deoxy-4-formamido-L-arabinose-phosphoundecaprenol deformylase [Gallionellaceae bacterium]